MLGEDEERLREFSRDIRHRGLLGSRPLWGGRIQVKISPGTQ